MTYSRDTTILGPSRGDAETIFAWAKATGCARPDEVKRYLDTVYRIAPRIGMRAELAVGQSIHETTDIETGAPWASSWWRLRLNPAGAGVTGDPKENAASPRFADGEAAAYAQLTHLWLYAVGTPLPTGLSSASDPRWKAAVDAGYAGMAPTLDGLTNRWAIDSRYAEKIATRLNDLDAAGLFGGGGEIPKDATMGEVDETVVFGRVPKFGMVDRQSVTAGKANGWDDLGQRRPKFVVLHRMLGSLKGTDQYFRTANALTDFGIGIAAQDGDALSKVIYQWNDPVGRRSGWASGPVNGAWGDGLALVDRYGVNVVNRDGVSLEISGQYTTPITDDEIQEIAGFLAYWWDQMRIPYATAPINPATGISAVVFHQEFTLGTGKVCPGPVVMDAINELIARAVAILKRYQTGDGGGGGGGDPVPEGPVYAMPRIPAWLLTWRGEPTLHGIAGVKDGTVFATTAEYRAIRATPRLQYATSGAQKVGPDIRVGERFPVAFIFTAADDRQYGVTKYGTRVLLGDLQVVADGEE